MRLWNSKIVQSHVKFRASPRSQQAQCPFEYRLVIQETSFNPTKQTSDTTIQEPYSLLASDEQRNELIISDALLAMEED